MKIVNLSIGKVEIRETLTWGMQEEVRAEMSGGIKVSNLTEKERQTVEMDPSAMLRGKYKLLEMCIVKITLNDGKEIPYSKEWMRDLSVEDGNTLFDAVNAANEVTKK